MEKQIGDFNESLFYQRIGEFVVSFQWIEDQFRQMGWFMLDPEMTNFPNEELREETNHQLLNKVAVLHDDFIAKYQIDTTKGYQLDFKALVARFHDLRKYRNNLLHSAYQELKAGGEVMGMLRANLKSDDPTLIDASDVEGIMRGIGHDVMHLCLYFTQLKHWYWAAVRPRPQATS